MIIIKKRNEIEKIKEACKIVADCLLNIERYIKPGITKFEINRLIENWIRKYKAEPAFLGYKGFPAASCISIDEEVVHGIPNGRPLKSGEIVSIDIGVRKDGYYGDGARSYGVDILPKDKERLIKVAEEALYKGVKEAKIGNRVGDISYAIQTHVEYNGFSVIKELSGHGIGNELHEEPAIPNFGKKGRGVPLKKGMVIAIEPMVSMGSGKIKISNDGWTVVTVDLAPSAHFEHTVLVDEEPIILTEV
ncbi:MAG: type I methionyl aminopeptidase [candidate division WOR-3 bacterium]